MYFLTLACVNIRLFIQVKTNSIYEFDLNNQFCIWYQTNMNNLYSVYTKRNYSFCYKFLVDRIICIRLMPMLDKCFHPNTSSMRKVDGEKYSQK